MLAKRNMQQAYGSTYHIEYKLIYSNVNVRVFGIHYITLRNPVLVWDTAKVRNALNDRCQFHEHHLLLCSVPFIHECDMISAPAILGSASSLSQEPPWLLQVLNRENQLERRALLDSKKSSSPRVHGNSDRPWTCPAVSNVRQETFGIHPIAPTMLRNTVHLFSPALGTVTMM